MTDKPYLERLKKKLSDIFVSFPFTGNVLASVFDNLDELMKRPYGCGEQNMLNFAPNIFLLEFYMSTDTLTPELKRTAVDYMIEGNGSIIIM